MRVVVSADNKKYINVIFIPCELFSWLKRIFRVEKKEENFYKSFFLRKSFFSFGNLLDPVFVTWNVLSRSGERMPHEFRCITRHDVKVKNPKRLIDWFDYFHFLRMAIIWILNIFICIVFVSGEFAFAIFHFFRAKKIFFDVRKTIKKKKIWTSPKFNQIPSVSLNSITEKFSTNSHFLPLVFFSFHFSFLQC